MANMLYTGNGTEKNSTKALKFFNVSSSYEPHAYYPSLIMQYWIKWQNKTIYDFSEEILNETIEIFKPYSFPFIGVISFITFYSLFMISFIRQSSE